MKHLYLSVLALFLSFASFAIGPITGSDTVCANPGFGGPSSNYDRLQDTASGGIWTSSDTSIATVSPCPACAPTICYVYGISAGTVTITYTIGTSYVTKTLLVMTNFLPSTLPATICTGSTDTLNDPMPPGIWSTMNSNIATVDPAGVLHAGLSVGTVDINYFAGVSSGSCGWTAPTTVISSLSSITGTTTVCAGSTTTLNNSVSGGVWSSSNSAVGTISPGSGLVTGVSPGTTIITYSLGTGCTTTTLATVNPLPTVFTLTGGGSYCAGGTGVTIGLSGSQTGVRYQLYLGATLVGGFVAGTGTAISFGLLTTVGSPYVAIATDTTTGCMSTMSGTPVVVINPLPFVYTVTGGGYSSGGAGVNIGLNGSQTGVNYQLYNGGIPAMSALAGTGSAVDFGPQTAAGTYMVMAINVTTGCADSMVGSATVAICTPNPIFGPSSVCSLPATFTVSDAAAGGTWSTSNSVLATINPITGPTPTVYTGGPGVAGATLIITYILPSTGCISTSSVTLGMASPIIGTLSMCGGTSVFLSDASVSGTWSCNNTLIATIDPVTGELTASVVSVSTAVGITYSLATGCSSTATVTVYPQPSIFGDTSVCATLTTQLSSNVAGGTWSSSNTGIAPVTNTGLVTGGSPWGQVVISYSLSAGCSATTTVTNNYQPGPIVGPTLICNGSSIVLSNTSIVGSWVSSSASVATIDPATRIVTALSPGATVISFTLYDGCMSATTVTVNPLPASITGPSSICAGTCVQLSDAISGGTWSTYNLSFATITVGPGTGGGLICALVTATTTVTYTLPTGCIATTTVTINPHPAPITGPSFICAPGSITLSDATPGGTWSQTNTVIAYVIPGGIVTSLAAVSGTDTISYNLPTGCASKLVITTGPTPQSITGPTSVCSGSTTTLSNATPGGTWSSSVPAVATIGINTGIVYAVAATGNTAITYTLGTGCSITTTVTVAPPPTVTISASPGDTVCSGTSVVFSAIITGGTTASYAWMVNGTNVGSGVTYTYIPTAGDVIECVVYITSYCSGATGPTFSNAITMVVNPLPAITATSSPNCDGIYTLVASGGATYSWSPATGLSCSSCATSAATISSTITYTVTGTDVNSCMNTSNVTVNGNRISGQIGYVGVSTDSFMVWLINYNPVDSQIIALDSTVTCMYGSTPYYQFNNAPAGNYMVKAKLFGTVPGTSGYIPTYSLSSSVWNTAATAAHTTATDLLNIIMLSGTVPPGPGFIGGNVYSGAGRGTSGNVPAAGMLIYLKDGTGAVLTYTFTDTTGAYSFSSLAYGDYIIYPENYSYYTTPSAIITLSAANPTATGVNFKEHTTFGTITPFDITGIKTINSNAGITIFPNPANTNLVIQWQDHPMGKANLVISDMLGREVYKTAININAVNGQSQLNLASLKEGIYLITIKSDHIYFSSKLQVEK